MKQPIFTRPNRVCSLIQQGIVTAFLLLLTILDSRAQTSFQNDVLPILTRAGCMAGACHAKSDGQNGFQLSIFSHNPDADYREIVWDARGRRIFPADPDNSLILLKATNTIPHEGEKRFEVDSEFYRTIRKWIADGAPRSAPNEPELDKISVAPPATTFKKGEKKHITVTAHYSDKSKRDVTHLCEFTSNDEAFAQVDEDGEITAGVIAGESTIIVRYIDTVDVGRVIIPPDKLLPKSEYTKLNPKNPIDEKAYERFQQLGLLPSPVCEDHEFIRRATLDVLGRLPDPAVAKAFLSDKSPDKRAKLIDELLSDKNANDYAAFWATKWGDLLRPNTQRVGVKPVYLLDDWIRQKLRTNTPWDKLVSELVTASGSTHQYGPVAIFRDKRTAADMAEFVSQLFLGVRMGCAKCHHHPSEKWSQKDYYSMAAFFGSMKRKGQGISSPISGEPEYWWFEAGATVKHPVTEAVMIPKTPDGPEFPDIPDETDPRIVFTKWLTSKDNIFFSKAMVNRIWGEMFGRGIVEPVDDFRGSNPPTNGPLLDWLASDFAAHGFDQKHTLKVIMNSNLYQQSSLPNEYNAPDKRNFSRSYRRRLPAEVLLDTISGFTGQPENLKGLLKGSPSMQQWNHLLPNEFLDAFGRPDSSAAPPCMRETSGSVVQALHLMNSKTLQKKLATVNPWMKSLETKPPAEATQEIYLRLFSRFPDKEELKIGTAYLKTEGEKKKQPVEDLIWSMINSAEFVLNH